MFMSFQPFLWLDIAGLCSVKGRRNVCLTLGVTVRYAQKEDRLVHQHDGGSGSLWYCGEAQPAFSSRRNRSTTVQCPPRRPK